MKRTGIKFCLFLSCISEHDLPEANEIPVQVGFCAKLTISGGKTACHRDRALSNAAGRGFGGRCRAVAAGAA